MQLHLAFNWSTAPACCLNFKIDHHANARRWYFFRNELSRAALAKACCP
jgi:hypothetical protein